MDIEEELAGGSDVYCASCPNLITRGDEYVMRGKYMYCCEECAEVDDEIVGPSVSSTRLMLNEEG